MNWKEAWRVCPPAGRSKRKRRKSHSKQRRAIDRGDEARSAICTRDRPLQRISRVDADGGGYTHLRTPSSASLYVRVPSRCVYGSFLESRYGGAHGWPRSKKSGDYLSLVTTRFTISFLSPRSRRIRHRCAHRTGRTDRAGSLFADLGRSRSRLVAGFLNSTPPR